MAAQTIANRETGSSVRAKYNAWVAEYNTLLSAAVTLTGTQTLTNKTLTSPVINSPTGIAKGDVGLGNADDTSDASKPVSTAQQTALDLKQTAESQDTLFYTIRTASAGITLVEADVNTVHIITVSSGGELVTIPNDIASGFSNGANVVVYNHTSSTDSLTITLGGSVTFTGDTDILPGAAAKIYRQSNNVYFRADYVLPEDLADIVALSPSNDDIIQRKAGAWTNRTLAQYKTDLALNNVDNTSDANKPLSTDQQTALDAKQDENAVSTVFDLHSEQSADITVGGQDNNTLWHIENGVASSLTINTGLAFTEGMRFHVYNDAASSNNVTVNGTATIVYTGSLNSTIAPGVYASFVYLGANTYLRFI